jgi:hypothetical protein
MTTILHDMFRAGIRHASTPQTTRMMFYIMAHAPGTTARMWRRALYGYLAHGMTLINLYEFRPCLASYTENYVDAGWGIYGAVRKGLSELTHFEDIIQGGRVADGDVGVWCSEAMDIWGPATQPTATGQHFNTFLSAKRAMCECNGRLIFSLHCVTICNFRGHTCLTSWPMHACRHCAAARRAQRGHGG